MLRPGSESADFVGRYTTQIGDQHPVLGWEREHPLLQAIVIVASVEVAIKDSVGFANSEEHAVGQHVRRTTKEVNCQPGKLFFMTLTLSGREGRIIEHCVIHGW